MCGGGTTVGAIRRGIGKEIGNIGGGSVIIFLLTGRCTEVAPSPPGECPVRVKRLIALKE